MTINSLYDYNQKVIEGGNSNTFFYRKSPLGVTASGVMYDISVLAGHPTPNYYATTPLVSALPNSAKGIQTGPNLTTGQKYVKTISSYINTAVRHTLLLCDYLLYYPFIDGDTTDLQTLTNSVALPSRGNNGAGVQMVLVAQGRFTGNGTCTINYTNQAGVQKSVSGVPINSVGSIGTVATNTFVRLSQKDSGVSSVQSIKFDGAVGGVYAIVLLKPLCAITGTEASVASERDLLLDTGFSMPEVFNESYLNFFLNTTTDINGFTVTASVQTVWG